MSRKVTLAYPYTDKSGKKHNADTSPTLPDQEAIDLLHSGRARAAGSEPATSAVSTHKAASGARKEK